MTTQVREEGRETFDAEAGHDDLAVFFAPQGVAVFGAGETLGSVGRTVMANLIRWHAGATLFPVSQSRSAVLGVKTYWDLASIEDPVDLALIATPPAEVPEILGQCLGAGIRGAIILAAGFPEGGPEGVELEDKIREKVRGSTMRVLGPNSQGFVCSATGMNATFAAGMVESGNIGFLSHSGSLLPALLDRSQPYPLGCSAFVSVGNPVNISWAEWIEYLGEDPHTDCLCLYLEGIDEPISFFAACRKVTRHKPIIVVQGPRTSAGTQRDGSHLGASLAWNQALKEALRRSGVLQVDSLTEMLCMANLLVRPLRSQGRRLSILTNASGPGVLATDTLVAEGGELAWLTPETVQALDMVLPGSWKHSNMIDLGSDAGPERYAQAVRLTAADANNDGVLVILAPQATVDPTEVGRQIAQAARTTTKPILASWMWGAGSLDNLQWLWQNGIPAFSSPECAVRIFKHLWQYSDILRHETNGKIPTSATLSGPTEVSTVEQMIQEVRVSGRGQLNVKEQQQLFSTYALPCVDSYLATTCEEALRLAQDLGYPVLLRLSGASSLLKTSPSAVELHARDPETVRRAYDALELIARTQTSRQPFGGVTIQPLVSQGFSMLLGSTTDPKLGPVLTFGPGGAWTGLSPERVVALPPLSSTTARQLIEQAYLLSVVRFMEAFDKTNLLALEEFLVRFSQLVVEQRWIKEITINPLVLSPEQPMALEARVILHGTEVQEKEVPQVVLATSPEPITYRWGRSR